MRAASSRVDSFGAENMASFTAAIVESVDEEQGRPKLRASVKVVRGPSSNCLHHKNTVLRYGMFGTAVCCTYLNICI